MSARFHRKISTLLTLLAVLALTAGAAISAQRVAGRVDAQAATDNADASFRSSPVMFVENAPQVQLDDANLQVLLRGGITAPDNGTVWERSRPPDEFPLRSTTMPAQSDVIAFESDRNGGFDIFTQEVGGAGSATPWLVATGEDVTPEWSPDGSKIVYASNRDGDFEIYVRTIGGQEQKLTNNTAEDAHPSWSPSGDRIIFTSNRGGDYFQIYSMRGDGSDVRQVGMIPGNHAMSPHYAANGNRIVFMRASEAIPLCQWNWDVWTMDANGGGQQRMTSHLAADMYPRWSPDGNQIIFAGCRNYLDFDLYTINPTNGVERKLTSWFLANEWAGTYSGDGRHIAFSTDIDGNVEIYIMSGSSGNAMNLTHHSASDGAPSWKPVGLELTPTPTPRPATYTISGRVTDTNGAGIPGVTVWAGVTRSTTTDANGNFAFTGLTAGTYNLSAEKTGYAICPHSRQVTVPPDLPGQSFMGLPTVASLGFCPSEDGYKFSNSDSGWGKYPSSPASGDFTMEDMRRMFGDQAVCLPPWMPGLPCAYKLSAVTWNFIVNVSMIKGHCMGMAATSLRFFKDIDQLSDFQAGATNTFGLDLSGRTRRNIAYYHVEQSALPIFPYKLYQQLTSTPARTLDALRTAMSRGALDPVVLVLKSGDNQHAVTPIAVEDRGGGLWAVWVYDNEYPGILTPPVEINTTNNTWRRGAWSGDAASHSLYTIPMSLFNGLQICPFCIGPIAAGTSPSETASGQIWLTENANLLITDSLGRRLGYVGNQLVSEIPGAGRVDFIGGTSHPAIPLYSIPLTETYTMLLDGQPLTRTQTLNLAQFGPGYAASVENLVVSPTTRDELSITIDGSQLQYRANVGKEATLTLTQDGANESCQLSLRDIQLHASKTITLTNDISAGRLVVVNNPEVSSSYNLAITRATATDGVKRFYHADLAAIPGDVQSFDYRAWDGSGSLVMQIDHNGDGSVDETQVLQNQIKNIYLPLVFRK